jgi:periplasmic copper chaperone A
MRRCAAPDFRFVEVAMSLLRTLCLALAWLPVAALARDYQLKSLSIVHPFTRATPPGANSGGAFFVIVNAGSTPDKLIGVASPAAGTSEIHQMAMDGGVMTMRAVPALEVPPGGKLELKPGGYHVMLLDLKQPLKVGDKVPLTITFQNAGSIDITIDVEAMGAMGGMAHKP